MQIYRLIFEAPDSTLKIENIDPRLIKEPRSIYFHYDLTKSYYLKLVVDRLALFGSSFLIIIPLSVVGLYQCGMQTQPSLHRCLVRKRYMTTVVVVAKWQFIHTKLHGYVQLNARVPSNRLTAMSFGNVSDLFTQSRTRRDAEGSLLTSTSHSVQAR